MNTTDGEGSVPGFPPILIAFIILQQLVFVVSFLGNSLVLFVFTTKLKLKNNTNKFLVNLAVSDLLCGIGSFVQLFYFLFPNIATNRNVCFLRYEIIGYTTLVSQLTVTFTAFDRFIAICHPHKYMKIMTPKVINIICVIQWVYPLIITSFLFLGWNIWKPGIPCIYSMIYEQMYYLLTAVTIYMLNIMSFIFYIFILRVAWRYYSRVRPAQKDVAVANASRSKSMEKDVRGAKVTGIVTLIFTICWIPYMSFPLQKGLGMDITSKVSQEVSNWLVFLGMLNSTCNPIIYAWKRPDFQKECKKIFCCLKDIQDSQVTTISTAIDG